MLTSALSLQNALAGLPAAALEGALVLLPQAAPFSRLARLRSPLWAAVLPGSIIVGTFGLIVLPWTASTTVMLAAITTPLLAALAVVSVVRGRWAVLPVAVVADLLAVLAGGWAAQWGASVVTALACLTIGAGLQRLIPARWMLAGVVAMSAADVILIAAGPGYHQTVLLAAAAGNFHGPSFIGARVGATTIGYPDLFLAALLGSFLAGGRWQRPGAILLALLVAAYDSLLSPGVLLPATVPIAATLIVVLAIRSWRSRRMPPTTPRAAAPPLPAAARSSEAR